jgi:hypothetical protein
MTLTPAGVPTTAARNADRPKCSGNSKIRTAAAQAIDAIDK